MSARKTAANAETLILERPSKPLGTARMGSNLLGLPFAEGLTPNSFVLPDDLSEDQWLDVGRALGRTRSSTMWRIGDWWAYGEHRYGERKALVESEDWEGPKFQTCQNAAVVCRAFTTYRRREVLSFTAHSEAVALPFDWQDKILDQAVKEGMTTRGIRDAVKHTRAFLSQGWTRRCSRSVLGLLARC